MALIEVENLVKEFRTTKKREGLGGSLVDLVNPQKTVVRAVDQVSFSIPQGQIVGYIGPNGAGKSTTIKMMCGILHPTSGSIRVGGLSPQTHRQQVVRNLGIVFGQRTQLYWDLRLGESFELLRRIYQVSAADFQASFDRLDRVLNLKPLMDRPVRQLSLGQRMRGDLAASMIHSPPVLFLDDPSIGLASEAKGAMRQFRRDLNEQFSTTIILTSHDLVDLQQLCHRVIVLNQGRVVEDGPLHRLVDQIAPYRYLVVDLRAEAVVTHPEAEVVRTQGTKVWLRFAKAQISASKLIVDLSQRYEIRDLSVTEPDIEDVIRTIYSR